MSWEGSLRPRLLTTVLVLSLALNLFILGGIAYSRFFPPGPRLGGHRMETLRQRLALKPDQTAALSDFARTLHRGQDLLAAENRPLLRQAWDEIAGDSPDTDKVKSLLDQMEAHRHAYQAQSLATLLHFTGALSPEQRKALGEMVLDRRDAIGATLRSDIGD